MKRAILLLISLLFAGNTAFAYNGSITWDYNQLLLNGDFQDVGCDVGRIGYIAQYPDGIITGFQGVFDPPNCDNIAVSNYEICTNNPLDNYCDLTGQYKFFIIGLRNGGVSQNILDQYCEQSNNWDLCRDTLAAYNVPFIENDIILERSQISNNDMFQIPTSTADTLLASVSSTLSDPGMLAVLGVVIGVPFAFYVIRKLIGLVPKR